MTTNIVLNVKLLHFYKKYSVSQLYLKTNLGDAFYVKK